MNDNKKVQQGYIGKIKSRLYGLLCEYEKDGEWEGFLDSILTEFLGYPDDVRTINYYMIFSKLSSARYLNYKYFRKTIFDVMSLVDKLEVSRDELF